MSSSGVTTSTSTSGAPIAITGLASGLDTSAIISELMAINRQPLDHITILQEKTQAQQQQLTAIQTSLQTLSADAAALSSPSLFSNTQAVTSSDSTRVSATSGSTTGAGVGGYQVSVSQLANSAQRTFTFVSPSSDDAVTIDGHQTTIKAGSSAADFVSAINSDPNATVYAATTDSGTVVLSNRTTGDTGTNFIQVADSGGSLTEQTGKAKEGQNAIFSVDGVQGTSTSNTVTSAIAGVSLNLTGVTTTSGPVTVNVAAPAPDPTAVTAAVKQFVTDYNSSISLISTQLTTVPVDNPTTQADASVGTLYGDTDLNSLLNNMRQQMYNPLAGLASDMNSLSEIGISTGAATGYATPTASSLAGTLQLDPDKLAAALTANPQGVEGVLRSFSFQFGTTVDGEAQPGGTLDSRISADNSQISDYGNQITQMNASLTLQQQSLTNEYAQLESTLSLSESQGSELSSEIAELG